MGDKYKHMIVSASHDKDLLRNIEINRPRLLFITQDDPFYIRTFFEEFLRIYPYPEDIAGAAITAIMGESKTALFKRTLSFFGFFGLMKMSTRIVSFKLKQMINPNAAYFLCKLFDRNKINIIRTSDVNGEEFLAKVKQLHPDLIVSVACPQIFKKSIIDIPGKGIMNIHHAPLPKYRGMLPTFWQLYNGESHLGVTVHEINERIDDGGIIFQDNFPVNKKESFHETVQRTKRMGAHAVLRAISLIYEPGFSPEQNRKELGSYYTFPSSADVERFRKKGFKTI